MRFSTIESSSFPMSGTPGYPQPQLDSHGVPCHVATPEGYPNFSLSIPLLYPHNMKQSRWIIPIYHHFCWWNSNFNGLNPNFSWFKYLFLIVKSIKKHDARCFVGTSSLGKLQSKSDERKDQQRHCHLRFATLRSFIVVVSVVVFQASSRLPSGNPTVCYNHHV